MSDEHLSQLNRLSAKALRELGDRGEQDQACRLAADRWSLLRADDPKEAERLNGILHYLTSTHCAKQGQENGASGTVKDFDLEVRHLAPAQRHELILETYHKLEPSQGFVLINDHDPKPLYYQFSFEYPEAFTWQSLESGPEVWRVRIGKP